ncbi:cystathionine gamma-lyase MccB [Clostridium aceticum]|uniref:Cystathionine gamma-lyase MccB n=2 Tax=Clostridium aceticum TaxID=84022 RepID=A0A0G3WDB8_9CLOT|nr:cystathionine gamma-lyase MccB [Clostridium aceticum]
MKKECLHMETKLVHGSRGGDVHTGAISFPIYQSATFKHPAVNESTGYDYSRVQNPTREELENTIAALEGGTAGFAFSTGMAAIATLFHLFSTGDHIIVSDDLYGGTYRLFEEICKKNGMEFSYIDTRSIDNIRKSIKANTRGIFIETPSNPMMKVTDIEALNKFTKDNSIILMVDNTFLTPYFQRPLALGADIVVHSGTKYLGGHNDTLAGFVVVKEEEMREKIELLHKTVGAVLAPFDCWLMLRGIKTLGIRMKKQQENAIEIANWLKKKEEVEKVYYVGLEDHEGYTLSRKQATGFGAMISFVVKNTALAEKILKNVKVISFAESLGGVESLITYPITQTHASIPEEIRKRLGIDERLLRLSVGIEDVNDLISDLEEAIEGEE